MKEILIPFLSIIQKRKKNRICMVYMEGTQRVFKSTNLSVRVIT